MHGLLGLTQLHTVLFEACNEDDSLQASHGAGFAQYRDEGLQHLNINLEYNVWVGISQVGAEEHVFDILDFVLDGFDYCVRESAEVGSDGGNFLIGDTCCDRDRVKTRVYSGKDWRRLTIAFPLRPAGIQKLE